MVAEVQQDRPLDFRLKVTLRLARLLLPRYSRRLELANFYALSRAWARHHANALTFPTRRDVYRYLSETTIPKGPIDYLEFGVARGVSLNLWTSFRTEPESRFFGFDSFLGLPEDWGHRLPAGSFSTGGSIPAVRDSRVNFVKGLFQETVPAFLQTFKSTRPLVVHMDADLYTSTLFCLAQIDRHLHEDSVLVFDELDSAEEFGAFYNYSRSFRREFNVICATRSFDRSVFRQVALHPAGHR